MTKERIILGIDPGTSIMGYGLIKAADSKLSVIAMGVLKLEKYTDHALKLKKIFERTLSLIDEFYADELAIEAPFYGKNVQSMLKLGRAQGVAMSAALSKELPIAEYSPRKVKQSITGNGNASKEQVAAMLHRLAGMDQKSVYLDATDALAVAVCHYFQKNSGSSGRTYGSWKAFVSDHPRKIRKK